MTHKYNRRKRRLHLENLECRDLFARDEVAFAGFGSMTFSIAPDGTHVGREVSTLQSKFGQVASTSQWQQSLARAFQKWSVHANINFGNVADNGDASGVYGPTRADERFGDVRITGFDYEADTFAEAVSENSRSVGTWAGDIFFNTAIDWMDASHIEAAALHEVGHILGLGHSDDVASPMHLHGPSPTLDLTLKDIQNLQAIHGTRHFDSNEGNNGNNSIAQASEIKGGEDDDTVVEGFSGNQVWIQFGDLHTATDRDVYEIKTSVNYSGPLSVELRTTGLSLAKLGVAITDRDGNVLTESELAGDFGGTQVLTLNQTTPESNYYLQVYAGTNVFWASGDYSITVANPTRLLADANEIAQWSRSAHRWYHDSDRTKDGFSYQLLPHSSEGPESDDHHTDDSFSNRVEMKLALSTVTRTVYQVVGTISDLVDVDYYSVVAPKVLNGKNELVLDYESLQVGGLVPEIRLFDKEFGALNPEVRVQGYGQTQLVWGNVSSEQEFVIELKSDSVSTEFKTGSFTLNATFSEVSTKPELLVAGTVQSGNGTIDREWYVAKPQLFGFSLEGVTSLPTIEGQVWVSIFDEQRRLVSGLVSPLNSLRSAPGLFLNPGIYYFQIASATAAIASTDVSFRLMVERPSQPIGPLLGGTNVQPLFLCPGSTTEYCYPNSTTPTDFTHQVGPSPTFPLPAPVNSPIPTNPSTWYWNNNFLPTNPSNELDVTGDGQVDPLDVLVIINAINTKGVGLLPSPPTFLGHLDTNSNGRMDPLDVLIVINFLNRR